MVVGGGRARAARVCDSRTDLGPGDGDGVRSVLLSVSVRGKLAVESKDSSSLASPLLCLFQVADLYPLAHDREEINAVSQLCPSSPSFQCNVSASTHVHAHTTTTHHDTTVRRRYDIRMVGNVWGGLVRSGL